MGHSQMKNPSGDTTYMQVGGLVRGLGHKAEATHLKMTSLAKDGTQGVDLQR